MFSDNNSEDLEKTTKMNEEPAAKPPKKPGDWVTAPMPAAPKPQAQPQPPAGSVPAPSAPAPSAPPAAYRSELPPPPSGGGFGSFLSNFGINDPNTQKWVLIIALSVLALCCICACLTFGLPLLGGFMEGVSEGMSGY